MNKKLSVICLILVIALCVTLCACKPNGGNIGDNEKETEVPAISFENGNLPNAVNATSDAQEHFVTTTLHRVNVTESNWPFIVDGKTDYTLIVDSDGDAYRSAVYMINTIQSATGVKLQILQNSDSVTEVTENDKYIVVGRRDLFTGANLSMPTDELGVEGYFIKSFGKSVFIEPNASYGYTYAATAFLRAVMGYEMYSSDTVVCTKDGSNLPILDIVEKPDFTLRYSSNDIEVRNAWGGQTEAEIFISVDGLLQHNCFKWLPPETFKNEHPGWFDPSGEQLCYTAHGDADEYELMIETIMEKMIPLIDGNPTGRSVTITMNDNGTTCSCDACMENYRKYGCHSASVVKFMNDVGKRVDDYLTEQAEINNTTKREFNIVFFAYMGYENAPAKLVNGKYQPIDEEVICRDNVAVYYAPIYARYTQSFYAEINSPYLETLKAWASCSSKLYLWLYETNFSAYLYPYPTYEACLETFRVCAENNPYMIRCQTQEQSGITCFGAFKDYLRAKGQFDANVKYSDCLDNFFENYFLEAAPAMRQYFDKMVAHYDYLLETQGSYITGNIYENISQADFWPKKMLDHWMELLDQAYQSIEMYREANPELYQKLHDHITLESIFPRYALIENYNGYYNSTELLAMKQAFKADCIALNVGYNHEQGSISSVWSSWGI